MVGEITHNMSRSKIYKVWDSMKGRCSRPHTKLYRRYGGRGITVCNEWLSFEGFYEWVKISHYEEGLCIDRKDNDGNYEPNNCHFITNKENNDIGKTGMRKDNRSGVVGVHWDTTNFKWYVQFKGIYLGRHKLLEDAIEIRNQAETEYLGGINNDR